LALKPGDVLRGKYRIDALIGRGGMGQVFAATDLETLQSQYAIKVVSRLMLDDVLMARLHREAEAAARIQSDWVPRVFEVGETDDGETFLVMDRLLGEPLSTRIRSLGALEWPEVAKIGEDVLRALIDAHTAGVVHRDLKPSNVFLALKSGRVRAMVLDFGVCKVDSVDVERLTATGESIGTVAYMAPEQIRGAAQVDERADLYAFGVLVFEMLSGRLPHEGPSQMAILASKLENPSARIKNWARVMIPEAADELIAKTLAREPRDRFANAQDLLKAWRSLSKADKLVPSTPPPPVARSAGEDEPTESPPRRRSSIPPTFGADAPEEPTETHSTQVALTTQGSVRLTMAAPRSTRLAFWLAAASLVVALVVVITALSRGAARGAAAAAAPPVETVVAAESGEPGETAEPPPPSDSAAPVAADLELPANSATSAPPAPPVRSRPRFRARSLAPPPPPPPRTNGPHITVQPRY
jgi:serine/threonine-protein kinase